MKRKNNKKKKKQILQKKNIDQTLDIFFSSNNKYKTASTKRSPSPILNSLNNNKLSFDIIRNPSKTRLLEESQQELKKYHNRAEKTILCDDKIIDTLYDKLNSSFEKINKYLVSNKKININNNINKKDLLTKFLLQLKYTDISYIPPIFLNENFNESEISQNLKIFLGYRNLKGITMNFIPNNLKECQIFWPNITEIVTKYLNNFHEGKGLYIYAKHDYLSYLDKIKLLCNLFNYETFVIEKSSLNKNMNLDKLSEAMQTKRLPSISDNLGSEILMLEEMVNSFSYKWEIFSKNVEQNKVNISNTISNDKRNDINNFSNNISSISLTSSISDISSNDKIKFRTKDISIINEELELKSKDSFSDDIIDQQKIENNIIKDDVNNKLDSSTNETLFINHKERKKSIDKIKDIKSIEQNKILLSKKDRKKSENKSRNKSCTKTNNKSNEYKKRRNKKNECDINNTDIKGYFRENTKEHKIFTQLQNNIFLYCTRAKTAIIISDSFSDKEIDKKYFNNILLKVSQTKCPIIVLSDNLDYLYNSQQKKVKNLNINCILSSDNKRDANIIYLYIFIIYLNIKLSELKLEKNIKTYGQLLEYINNNINVDKINYELNNTNLKNIYNLSEYLCNYGRFQIEVIDLHLTEIFNEVEREIKEGNLNQNDFKIILEYIYNIIFKNMNNIFYNIEEGKNIKEIVDEWEINSFFDYSDRIEDYSINKYYKEKVNLNDSYKNYLNLDDSMVNLEGLILKDQFNEKKDFKSYKEKNKNDNQIIFKSFSIYDSINNKIINKIQKSDQLYLSYSYKRFITIPSLYNYIYPINQLLKYKKIALNYHKVFEKFFEYRLTAEESSFIDIHILEKIFKKIEDDFFFNESNINYSTNLLFKRSINQKKIRMTFYDK